MKQIVIALGVVIVMFVLFTFRETLFTSFENTAEYQKAEVIEIVEEEEEEVIDIIDAAKADLERINLSLDREEIHHLEEKDKLKREYDIKQAEIEIQLERIRETRTSFQ